MTPTSGPEWRTGAVGSRDGTTIGFRQIGEGPGVVLLHGGMVASQHFAKLGEALSDQFTVSVPDRRGRGMSGPDTPNHGLGTEVEDLDALLEHTGAHNVFGLSSGAVIALQAGLELGKFRKLALYEPPLSFDGVSHTDWVPRYEREVRRGKLPSALVTVLKGTGDSVLLRWVPRGWWCN